MLTRIKAVKRAKRYGAKGARKSVTQPSGNQENGVLLDCINAAFSEQC